MIQLIETIYSNENEASDRTSKAQASFHMPKNIRQVGKSNTVRKIYVEDYVMSFIKQLSGGEYTGCKVAVLVGQCIKIENCRNIFISGAVEVTSEEVVNDFAFTNDTWTSIYEDIKKYYVETEIVGWYIGGPGYLFSEEDKILKTHIDNFAGQDKVLLTYDSLEKEETFLSYENNQLCKLEGYYIYYEKNDEMQNYMIDHRNPQSMEADYEDKVSKNIRAVIQNKKPAEEENKNVTKLIYAAGTLLAVIVLIVGAAMLRNYDQMKSMQDTLNYLTKNMENVQAAFTGSDNNQAEGQQGTEQAQEDSLNVEVVPGDVEPLPGETGKALKEEKKSNEENDSEDTITDKELVDGDKKDKTEVKNVDDNAAGKKVTKKDTDDKSVKDKAAVKDSNEVNYYVVTDGDTLADISYKLYNTYTRVKKIMELNNITDQDLIYVGQKLIVP